MAKIGKKPLAIPDKVKVSTGPEGLVVEGPKGRLVRALPKGVQATVKDSQVTVGVEPGHPQGAVYQGLVRGLLQQMLVGVTQGYTRALELEGVGFRASVKGQSLEIALGFSHPVIFPIEKGLVIKTPKPNSILIEGIDKGQVGQAAARIRSFYPPEPYKGKGVHYAGEQIRRKQGKAVG
ncbi:MAG: 50S ribosomal protein L6 [Candidatus Omnitrophica bacterium]|nr:50S ribosomal protein L6 [Candidatus Omnitrophota bacterium]